MPKESMGAFIDAVYAIAITILALEIKGDLSTDGGFYHFKYIVLEYALAFTILFALWIQHRRLNQIAAEVSKPQLLLHGFVLLIICLIPRAVSLVFDNGSSSEFLDSGIGADMNALGGLSGEQTVERIKPLVNFIYCATILAADIALLALMLLIGHTSQNTEQIALRHGKLFVTGLLVVALGATMATPIANRYFGIVLPLGLIFETYLSQLAFRSHYGRSIA